MKEQFRAVSREQAARIQLMYQELEETGRRKYTLSALGEIFGCGETTIYRIVNRKGPYRRIEARNAEQLEVAAEASQVDFLRRLSADVAGEREETTAGNKMLEELSGEAQERAKRLRGDE